MNNRERVLAAASRQRTDRPPTSLRCTPEAWAALRNYLHVASNGDVFALGELFRRIARGFVDIE